MKITLFPGALALLAQPVLAEVEVQDANGFVIQHELPLKSAPERVWEVLAQPQFWWDPAHSWSGDADNFSLVLEPGGCFCETLPAGGFAEHLRVVFVQPQQEIRLSGGLGPLQGLGFDGVMTWQLADTETGSLLRWTYRVDGRVSEQLQSLPSAVDGVLRAQLLRLSESLGEGRSLKAEEPEENGENDQE